MGSPEPEDGSPLLLPTPAIAIRIRGKSEHGKRGVASGVAPGQVEAPVRTAFKIINRSYYNNKMQIHVILNKCTAPFSQSALRISAFSTVSTSQKGKVFWLRTRTTVAPMPLVSWPTLTMRSAQESTRER